jgi:hypothetical protein
MRPTKVMEALKNHVETFVKNGGKIEVPQKDSMLIEIQIAQSEPSGLERAYRNVAKYLCTESLAIPPS